MTGLFVLLLLLSVSAFVWSLFKPQTFQPLFKDKLAENNIGRFFCYIIIISFIGIGITTPNKENNNQPIVQPAATSQTSDQKAESQSSVQTQSQQEKIEQPQQIQQPKEIQPQQKAQEEAPTVKIEESKPSTSVKPSYATPTYTAPTSCADDYYKNSDGICVHSPSNNPSGATAKCRDGSYSYSLHRRGTCSGHGGVAVWY